MGNFLVTIISEYKPKANYYDVILSSKNAINISVIAKDYGMSAKLMNKKLNELGVIFKSGDTWLPYAKYAKKDIQRQRRFLITAVKGQPFIASGLKKEDCFYTIS